MRRSLRFLQQKRAPEWRPDGRRREVKGYAAFSMSSVTSKSCCEQLLMRPSSVSSISSRLSRSAWNSCWFFHRKLEMQQLPLEDKRQQSRFAAEAPKKLNSFEGQSNRWRVREKLKGYELKETLIIAVFTDADDSERIYIFRQTQNL